MENLIKTIKKRHEDTFEYYQNEMLTEREKKIIRSEMSFLLMMIDEVKYLHIKNTGKRYAWLRPDGTMSGLWDDEEHNASLVEEDIKDAEKKGWKLLKFNVC